MISSTSIASISAAQPRREALGAIYVGDLGSETFDRVRAEGREATEAELNKIHHETLDLSKALHGFMKAGVADPLAAAREAVAKTRAQEFDSRNAALSDAVRSVDLMFRATGVDAASRSSIAAAESVRAGANASLLGDINHVVARENSYLRMVNGRINVTAAMLERDFSVIGTTLERNDSGAVSLGAFELSHEKYGKLLSVDGEGNITLFDQNGDNMDATAYVNALFGGGSVFGTTSNDPRAGLVDRRM